MIVEILKYIKELEFRNVWFYFNIMLNSAGTQLADLVRRIDSREEGITDEKLKDACLQISEFSASDFNDFISPLITYLFVEWDERKNFEALRFVTDLLGFVIDIAPQEVTEELENALRNSKCWHAKLLLHMTLFSEGISDDFEKTPYTLPLELFKLQTENKPPDENVIKRILALKDEKLYKFCMIILEELCGNSTLTNLENKLVQVEEQIDEIVKEHGENCLERVKLVLNRKFQLKNGREAL